MKNKAINIIRQLREYALSETALESDHVAIYAANNFLKKYDPPEDTCISGPSPAEVMCPDCDRTFMAMSENAEEHERQEHKENKRLAEANNVLQGRLKEEGIRMAHLESSIQSKSDQLTSTKDRMHELEKANARQTKIIDKLL